MMPTTRDPYVFSLFAGAAGLLLIALSIFFWPHTAAFRSIASLNGIGDVRPSIDPEAALTGEGQVKRSTEVPVKAENVAEAISTLAKAAGGSPAVPTSAALITLERAAGEGNVKALVALGNAYRSGGVIAADPQRAIGYFTKADELGEGGAALILGFMYARGEGVVADVERAVRFLERGIPKQENAGALKLLGDLYRTAGSSIYDPQKARGYYERAAALKNDAAYLALGDMWRRGEGGDKSDAVAADQYERALALGSQKALRSLASLHQAADSSIRNPVAAADYFRRAALLGDEKAALALAQMYVRDEVSDDPTAVIPLLVSVSGSQEGQARKLLGDIYRKRGAPRDIDLATQSYRRAADLGNSGAMLALGDLLRANPKSQSTAEAKGLYEAAANLGIARAYVRLGDLAWQRRDLTRETDAVRHYEQAERLGDALASLRLAQIDQGKYQNIDSIKNATRRYKTAMDVLGPDQTTKQMLDGDPNGLIAIVQVLLASHGHNVGKVDGRVGPKTIDEMGKFCAEQQIEKCGRVHGEVLTALLKSVDHAE